MTKARKRNSQLDKNLARLRMEHGRIIVDDELIDYQFDSNEERHMIHYFLACHLHELEMILAIRHLED